MEGYREEPQMSIEIEVPVLDVAGKNTGEYVVKTLTKEEFVKRAEALPDMKVCLKCKKQLPLVDFGKDKRQTDGINRYCKVCHRANCAKARSKRKKPCVYQLFFTDGCTYIGSTTQNFNDRLAVHRAKVKKNIHTNHIFNRYEPEDISGRVLMEISKEHELRMNEYVLIKHYKNLYGNQCLNAYEYTGVKVENKGQENEGNNQLGEHRGSFRNGIGPTEEVELES
jgi:hypothetical protein